MAELNGWWMRLALFILGLWTGSVEFRLRKKVNGDRIQDLKQYIAERIDSLEGRLERIEDRLLNHRGDPCH